MYRCTGVVLFLLAVTTHAEESLPTPDEVAKDIVETHSEAAKETAKLLSDPLNYEEASNPDSKEVALGADVDDSADGKLQAAEAHYADFLNVKEIRKYKKFKDRRIAIPVYRVAYTVQTKAGAEAMAGLDRNRGAVRTSMTVVLGGVDTSLMQEITDRAYKDYLSRLTEAGFEVVPFEEIKQTKGYQQIKFVDDGYGKNAFGTAFAVYTPTGMPLFWEPGNPMGNVGFGMGQGMNRISSETKATVILPLLVINFAEMSSSGRSFLATTAKVGAEMGITLNNMTSQHFRIGHPMVSTAVEFMGNTTLREPLSIAGDFGEMLTTDSSDDQALTGLLSRGLGSALSSRVSESRLVKADASAYRALTLQALATGNDMFISALADARDGKKPPKRKKRR